jgi:hypothetical protein
VFHGVLSKGADFLKAHFPMKRDRSLVWLLHERAAHAGWLAK